MDWFGICCLVMLILGIIICIIAYRRAISKMLDEIGKEAAALETRHTELEHSYQILRANVHNEERDALRKEELDSIRQGAQKEYEDYRKAQYDAIGREVEAKRNEANMALRRELDKAEEEAQMEQLRLVRLRDISNEEMNAIRSELNTLQAQRNDFTPSHPLLMTKKILRFLKNLCIACASRLQYINLFGVSIIREFMVKWPIEYWEKRKLQVSIKLLTFQLKNVILAKQ